MPRRPAASIAPPLVVDARGEALDLDAVATIVDRVGHASSDLIPILQRLQNHFGYLPEAVLAETAQLTGIPSSRIYGVVTFYSQFSTVPQGRRKICVCQGTACHVRGGHAVLRAAESELGIKAGKTSDDLAYSLESAACLGACSLAPVMTVDGRYFGKLTGVRISAALEYATNEPESPDED